MTAINAEIVTRVAKEYSISEKVVAMCLLAAQIRNDNERRERA